MTLRQLNVKLTIQPYHAIVFYFQGFLSIYVFFFSKSQFRTIDKNKIRLNKCDITKKKDTGGIRNRFLAVAIRETTYNFNKIHEKNSEIDMKIYSMLYIKNETEGIRKKSWSSMFVYSFFCEKKVYLNCKGCS